MVKTSSLPPTDNLAGNEDIIVVQQGITKRGLMSGLALMLIPLLSGLAKGDPGSPGEGYHNRPALALAGDSASNLDDAYLTEKGRAGKFIFSTSNFSAEVAADTQQANYVATASDPTGASGAWVRQYDFVKPEYFGAVGDGTTDDAIAIQAAIDFVDTLGGGEVHFSNGKTYRISALIRLKTKVSLYGNGATIDVDPTNYTGGITQFYGAFSTVAIASRPQAILWRIGTGTIAYENITVKDITFQLNRDGSALTSEQMDGSEFNAIRFEDARNCKILDCNFIDGETSANNNGTQVVFFVRSDRCEARNCYSNQTTFVYMAECNNCVVADNEIPISVGTAIESVAGKSHKILRNKLGTLYWAVSCIGVNTPQCIIEGNTIDESALTGVTLGHSATSGGSNYYNLPLVSDYSICRDNQVLAGDDATTEHGYIGVLVQSGSYLAISDNSILNLRKKTNLNDRAGAVLVQPSSAADAKNLRIERNTFATANNGIHVVRGETLSIKENRISDVYAGVFYESTSNAPAISISGNSIDNAERAVSLNNGNAQIYNNIFTNISDGSFSVACTRGHFRIENNMFSECGEIYLGIVKSISLVGNVFLNAVVTARAANLDNSNSAGTATIDLITVAGNVHPGTTDMLKIANVLGQSTRTIEHTIPTQFTTTSYNVGSLPTDSIGLSSGDIWNDAGTLKVV